jgi:hypothetical protein
MTRILEDTGMKKSSQGVSFSRVPLLSLQKLLLEKSSG